MLLVRVIAEVPRSICDLYSAQHLAKRYRQQRTEQTRNKKQVAVSAANGFMLSPEGEQFSIDKKVRVLYRTMPEIIRLISKVNAAAMCPAYGWAVEHARALASRHQQQSV